MAWKPPEGREEGKGSWPMERKLKGSGEVHMISGAPWALRLLEETGPRPFMVFNL